VFGRNQFVSYFGVGSCSRGLFELFGEGLIVEEGPGVVELVVPSTLKVAHALQHVVELFIADQTEDRGVDARTRGIVWGVVVTVDSSQRLGRFAGG